MAWTSSSKLLLWRYILHKVIWFVHGKPVEKKKFPARNTEKTLLAMNTLRLMHFAHDPIDFLLSGSKTNSSQKLIRQIEHKEQNQCPGTIIQKWPFHNCQHKWNVQCCSAQCVSLSTALFMMQTPSKNVKSRMAKASCNIAWTGINLKAQFTQM